MPVTKNNPSGIRFNKIPGGYGYEVHRGEILIGWVEKTKEGWRVQRAGASVPEQGKPKSRQKAGQLCWNAFQEWNAKGSK